MTLYRLSLLTFLSLVLAGCQMIDSAFGIDGNKTNAVVAPAPAPIVEKKPAPRPSTQPSLVIYVGAITPIDGYIKVVQKGQVVFVDPHQTLLYSDLLRALAVLDQNNRPYVNLEFSPQGTQKLSRLTGANIGKNLIVTLNNELISIFKIDGKNTTGVLQVPMDSVLAAQTFERRVLDGE